MLKGLIIIMTALVCAAVLFFILPELSEARAYNTYVAQGILFALLSVVMVNTVRARYKDAGLPPSIFLVMLFLLIPPIGILGYNIITKAGVSFSSGRLDFDHPLYLWYLGTMVFSSGLAVTHMFLGRKIKKSQFSWDFSVLKAIMNVFILVATVFTILAVYKIGYIPILKGTFDIERFSYDIVAGEYTMKFSRLWLIVFMIAIHLYFLAQRKVYILIMLLSAFCLIIYGNRTYMFMPIVYFILLYIKHKRLVNLKVLLSIAIVAISLFYYIHQVREGRSSEMQKIPAAERVVPFIFGEWREYSYVINNFDVSRNSFLREKIFLGVVSTFFPKQVWQLFGLDKDEMFSYNAAEYFRKYFGHYAGIRITIIGECYVGYGIGGICVLMALLGAAFSFFENLYITLEEHNPLLMFVGFVLSILMLLPLLTFINITSTIVFFGFFICLVIFFGGRKRAAAL